MQGFVMSDQDSFPGLTNQAEYSIRLTGVIWTFLGRRARR